MKRTAIVRCGSYDLKEVHGSLTEIIGATEFPEVAGRTVLVKPNVLSDSAPEKAITTHPAVVEALVMILKDMGAGHIIIGDSPGMQAGRFNPKASGIADVAARTGAELADFAVNPRIHQVGSLRIPMAEALDRADIVISAAKLKTHQLMYATGVIKNLFGTVPGLNKSPLHLRARKPEEFAALILAIFREAHVDYSIMDAIVGMEGPGPSNGSPREIGLLIGGANPYAIDKAEARIMGYRTVPIVSRAEEEMPGCTETEYPFLSPEEVRIDDFSRIGKGLTVGSLFLASLLSAIGIRSDRRPFPSFQHRTCRRCGKCIEVCPAKALSLTDGKVTIDKERCIRCYCCHEMCPFDAIKVK